MRSSSVDLPNGYEWRYQKLPVIVFCVEFQPCMYTCLSSVSPTWTNKHKERLFSWM